MGSSPIVASSMAKHPTVSGVFFDHGFVLEECLVSRAIHVHETYARFRRNVPAIPSSPQEWQNTPLSQGCFLITGSCSKSAARSHRCLKNGKTPHCLRGVFLIKGWCAEPSRLAPQGRSPRSVSLVLRELSHPTNFL